MRHFAGSAGLVGMLLLALGCGKKDPPPTPSAPNPPAVVPAIQVQKQADGLFYRTGELHPFTVHFGLGNVTSVDSLEVRWPDGRVTRLADPPAGKYHMLSASKAGLDKPGEGR
jgi:hypothetical protein